MNRYPAGYSPDQAAKKRIKCKESLKLATRVNFDCPGDQRWWCDMTFLPRKGETVDYNGSTYHVYQVVYFIIDGGSGVRVVLRKVGVRG